MAMLSRRAVLAGGVGVVAAAAGAVPPVILFVHGNGDTAGLWITVFWRFESNGYPPDRLYAVDLRNPTARNLDDQPMPGRSSSAEVMHQLADEVAAVRARLGLGAEEKIVLVAQSRGGNTVRNYLKNGGGAAFVSAVVLCGTVDHGVFVSDTRAVTSEFNGASPLMRDLNSTQGEVIAGIRFLTLRSDHNDKYAQPDGRYLGMPGTPTGVGFDAPALAGATNLVLPGVDHRETGFSPQAFAAMYRFITGEPPATMAIVPEAQAVLNGKVSGWEAGQPTNIAVAGAEVTVFRTMADTGERVGDPVHHAITRADGLWGPFAADPRATYEFVAASPGLPTRHIYRSPFPRSSDLVAIRPMPFGPADQAAGAVVYMTRPRGYFGLGRDLVTLDGAVPTDIADGVPSVATTRLALPATPQRAVIGRFRDEIIAARQWPAAGGALSVIELTF